ncbi:hypothetical protein SK128_012388 [Halocaridina rubra]|uniref:Uncharacterized protein n=1 Tax=Halocaridina rubra TaxID=373956 RepID=A0AAN8WDL2_HALRR
MAIYCLNDLQIYELPVMEGDPLYSDGSGTGVTSGEEGVEWISGRVISSRVLACGSLSRSDWVNKIVERSKLLVTPLFLHDLCVLNLAQRAGVPYVGVLTSRVGSWWVWEQLGTLPLLSTNPVPPSTMEDNSIWSRTVNVARHYRYLSSLRQQWQVPALTVLDPSWSPLPLHALYAGLARVLVTWDPLLHAHFPFSSMVVPVGGFSFETGHMTKDLLVSSLKNRAGVITVLPGGREAWLGASALQDVHSALQSTSYTILWKATFPYMQPNVTQEGDVTYNAKFVYKEEVPLNDILSKLPSFYVQLSPCPYIRSTNFAFTWGNIQTGMFLPFLIIHISPLWRLIQQGIQKN